MEQGWCGRNGETINNIFCSKHTKARRIKTDEIQVNKLGKDGEVYCRVTNERK